ncbi:hypothetical protein [Chitinophaga sp. HK235]|uniref:DUF6892 domain-containing protein n=1 Tax=Chitinophaga sp. HK235 TaxID=2952571 RepID=UPI001BA466CF|nr:hypothetical protein [Chitinophaga sp. HK235]
MQITITDNSLLMNGDRMQFPLNIQILQQVLGKARYTKTKYNHIYTWDELGVLAYSQNGQAVEGLTLDLLPAGYAFSPTEAFTAEFRVEETAYQEYYQQNIGRIRKTVKNDDSGSLVVGDLDLWFDIEDNAITAVVITKYVAPAPKVYSDKYKYRKIEGEKIEFIDFNFKLAVVQQLMYEQKLLKPEFDLYEFAENHQEREIDIEAEGYAFIPEVLAYFQSLEVDKKYAEKITGIQQDGGDEIYGQLLRFWDGEDDTFNIRNFEDVKHFPNLRNMTLFYDADLPAIKEQLSQKNIVVEEI